MADIRLLICLQVSEKVNAPPAPISTENGTDLQLFGRFVGNLTETGTRTKTSWVSSEVHSMLKHAQAPRELNLDEHFRKECDHFPTKNVSEW